MSNFEHIIDVSSFSKQLQTIHDKSNKNPYDDLENFVMEATLLAHELPNEIRQKIIEFKRRGNVESILLIKGLPTDEKLPKLPISESNLLPSRRIVKPTFVSEFWLVVFGTLLGEPVGYAQEKQGEIFQNLFPVKGKEYTQSSESSQSTLDFHTETAFHEFLPDFLLLFCLRQDHNKIAETTFISTIYSKY